MSSVVISGNTSGSVTLAAPDVAGTTTQTLPLVTGNVLNDANCGVCKAWVNFNGVTTVTIRGSYNVSSVTRGALGFYTINFTSALVDANYIPLISMTYPSAGFIPYLNVNNGAVSVPPTSSGFAMAIINTTGSATSDATYVSAAAFR